MSEDMSEIMSKDRSERMAKDMSERISERYVRRYVIRKSVKRFVRKNVKRYVRKNGERYVRKNVRRYVRKNVRRYVRQNVRGAYIDLDDKTSCLHQRNLVDGILFLFYLAHCSKYCWLVERPETIFIGTANRVAKGVEHVWRYKLTFVGAERMYVCMDPPSTTHAGDLMFIMEEVVEGNKWYVAYEGRACSKAGEARCSLSYFGLVLGEWSARVGDK